MRGLVAALLGLILAAPQWAGTISDPAGLPDPQFFIRVGTPAATVAGNTFGAYSVSCNPQASLQDSIPLCASAVLTQSPVISITSSVRAYAPDPTHITANADYATFASVQAQLDYFYAVVGPARLAPIPLQLNGTLSCSYSAGTITRVSVGTSVQFRGVDSLGNSHIALASCDERTSGGPFQLQTSAFVGDANVIALATFFQIQNFGSASNNDTEGIFSGTVDPVVSFAPGFDSTGYSIIVNSGLSNSAGTPEPGTAGLLTSAGVLFSLLLRRRILQGMSRWRGRFF